MMNSTYLINDACAWIKRNTGFDEVIRIILDLENAEAIIRYLLYTADDEQPEYLGRILFDTKCYWIYDGDLLSVVEQEQLAKFIINYGEDY